MKVTEGLVGQIQRVLRIDENKSERRFNDGMNSIKYLAILVRNVSKSRILREGRSW